MYAIQRFLNNTLLSQACIPEVAPTVGTMRERTFQGWGRGEEPPSTQVQLIGQLVVTASPSPPPTIT